MNSRGRDRFHRFSYVIKTFCLALNCMPRRYCAVMLAAFRHFPGTCGMGIRYCLVKRLAAYCGDCVSIHEGVYLLGLENISLGNNVSIHPMCYISGAGGVTIGSDVSIAHGVSLLSTEHTFSSSDSLIRDADVKVDATYVGSDVWIGCGVRVLAGSRIGDRVVVAANSVVRGEIPGLSLVAGTPAVVKRTITARVA